MTDQHRHDALGCVTHGVQTPNLDRLAREGTRFSQAVCQAPICVPSRYSLMTGLYPSQSGLRHNLQMCPTDEDLPLPTLAQRLQAAGYQTCGVGKTHWYFHRHVQDKAPVTDVVPSTRGFELRFGPEGPGFVAPGAVMRPESEWTRLLADERRANGSGGESPLGYTGYISQVPPEEHLESWYGRQAEDFLEHHRDPQRPFFLYLSLDFPHPGFNVPAGYEERYDLDAIPDRIFSEEELPNHGWPFDHISAAWKRKSPDERRETTRRYYALCTFVDHVLGRVLAKLDEIGERENSVVLFCSDHGEMLGNRNHRFSKFCLYEGAVRVPLIVAGAGFQAGKVDEQPAELVDILPTLLSAAQIEVPPQLPGVDLSGVERKTGSFSEWHGGGHEGHQVGPTWMWRTSEWKLLLKIPTSAALANRATGQARGELYHLPSDPVETHNLYDDPAHFPQREAMTRELLLNIAANFARYPSQFQMAPLQRAPQEIAAK